MDNGNEQPLFPKGEGPGGHLVTPGAEPASEAEPKHLWTPGSDGFGVETTFTVDNSTPGSVIVQPGEPVPADDPIVSALPAVSGITQAIMLGNYPDTFELSIPNGDIRYTRFQLRRSRIVRQIAFLLNFDLSADATVELAIFDLYTRVATTGVFAPGVTGPAPIARAIGPVTLLAGRNYYACFNVASGGNVQITSWGGSMQANTILAFGGSAGAGTLIGGIFNASPSPMADPRPSVGWGGGLGPLLWIA